MPGTPEAPARRGGDQTGGRLEVRPAQGFVAARMAAQPFRALRGRSTWVTPSGASASITALAMAGVESMVAASPMPLTPSVVRGESVRVWSFSIAWEAS